MTGVFMPMAPEKVSERVKAAIEIECVKKKYKRIVCDLHSGPEWMSV